MKRKICVRSMVLGAVMMLIGLAVGAIVSPPLIAQRNSVFDKVTCRELEVVNAKGKKAIRLISSEKSNGIVIYNERGDSAVDLGSFFKEGNKIAVYNVSNSDKVGIGLSTSDELVNAMSLTNYYGKPRIWLSVDETGDSINIIDWMGKIKWSAP